MSIARIFQLIISTILLHREKPLKKKMFRQVHKAYKFPYSSTVCMFFSLFSIIFVWFFYLLLMSFLHFCLSAFLLPIFSLLKSFLIQPTWYKFSPILFLKDSLGLNKVGWMKNFCQKSLEFTYFLKWNLLVLYLFEFLPRTSKSFWRFS